MGYHRCPSALSFAAQRTNAPRVGNAARPMGGASRWTKARRCGTWIGGEELLKEPSPPHIFLTAGWRSLAVLVALIRQKSLVQIQDLLPLVGIVGRYPNWRRALAERAYLRKSEHRSRCDRRGLGTSRAGLVALRRPVQPTRPHHMRVRVPFAQQCRHSFRCESSSVGLERVLAKDEVAGSSPAFRTDFHVPVV